MVKVTNGGYEDIVIAINPAVKENVKIIESIQNMVKGASDYLFKATKQRLFIRSAKILIPFNWTSSSNYRKPRSETYDKADVIIANPYFKYGDEPYTLQYGGCGDPGKYIHFTPDFLLRDSVSKVYGPPERVFVHEWSHLRWGVFDEYNTEVPYYIAGNGKVEATRCSLDILGSNTKLCNGSPCPCYFDPKTGLYEDGCQFVPIGNQFATESIMYMQALSSVSEFCDANTHNPDAPTLQNRVCNYRSTWDVIMDSNDIKSNPPRTDTNISVPTFSLLQYKDRVVTLVLDVSGSMSGDRIQRLYQAADVYLIQIVELGSYVGIVTFHSSASVVSPLVQVLGQEQRLALKRLIPSSAGGGTNICAGVRKGFEVNKKHDGSSDGTEIVLLTDGEDNYDTSLCFPDIRSSGAIIHIIALGPSAAKELEQIADMTGGLKFFATDKVDANGLIDIFSGISSGNGNISQQAIQLESTANNCKPQECLNGTVFIDSTVGNETFFLVTWQSPVPTINLQDPKGILYAAKDFTDDTTSKSSRLEIPGTAERGPWTYSICNNFKGNQVLGITVNSKAVDQNVPPVTVNAHMSKDMNQFPSPMIVYASVSQGMLPVKGAKVTAIVEAINGNAVTLDLLDNGAGADIIRNDGIYSRYFTTFTANGRYSLKVRVENKHNTTYLALPRSRALYIPGYVENGVFIMNPPKPVVNDDDLQLNLGPFSRTASGGSFIVSDFVPVSNDFYKPDKITDLEAKIEENTIVLYWTATGDDLDQGSASFYDLRMNTNPQDLRDEFNSSTTIDISSRIPKPAGSRETFTFSPENVTIANGTILYFALIAFDKVSQVSDLSNIAQAALLIPSANIPTTPFPSTNVPTTLYPSANVPSTDRPIIAHPPQEINIAHLALIICSTIIIISLIISITVCIISSKEKEKNPQMEF
ncbi:calcium-activated chloride channel regulator 1-like [Discoglossus pictus]